MSAFEYQSTPEVNAEIPREYVDVHCHIIHERFAGDEEAISMKCREHNVNKIIVNGLEPKSNRAVLELCQLYDNYLPALGIYPLDAACNVISSETWQNEFPPPERFDVDAEIDFIEEMVVNKRIIALGECGLDKHYLTDDVSMQEQERVLRKLMKLSVKYDIPIILHTRKAEERVLAMLQEEGVRKADFHCFCGKTKLGKRIAEAGYYLSIPPVIEKAQSFQKLVEVVPLDKLLTETDSPYMGIEKGERNDPSYVVRGVTAMAKIKGISEEEMMIQIRKNFRTLFNM